MTPPQPLPWSATATSDPEGGEPYAGGEDLFAPERLAALVNEALVEQALRHGVDLT